MIRPLLIALLAASPVGAASSLQPPARFDHRFDGPETIIYHNGSTVRRQCLEVFGVDWGPSVKGCGGVVEGVCTIIVARYAKVSSMPMLIRHERAHCNGWSAEHER